MKTVLVTGGAGFIGSHVVVELVKAGYRPVIIDNFSNSERPVIRALQTLLNQEVTLYDCDYQNNKKLKEIGETERPIGVIHFAAFKAVNESVKQPLKYYDNNVAGLIKLMKFIKALTKLKHFVYSSSCMVYGEPDQLPVKEDSPWKPATSPYGTTKQMGETISSDTTVVSKHFNALSLRYFNPIGAHASALIGELPIGKPQNLVPFITQTAAKKQSSLTVFGNDYPTPDGSCIRDYIHVVDLAKAHVKALMHLEEKPPAYYDVFNIGTGHGSSVLEVIKTFEQVTDQKLMYTIGPRRLGDLTATYASIDKARKVLNWKAEKSLAEALSDAWRWQQKLA
ncbi:MAG TPA: UDP-glucose 4-epimerase GalE [Candidatus Saccharimonadales bacterium]|nr:UDP-glucose 4-epimerase GalE [Candidatus Saccharimonadales bacterium]